MRACTHKGDNSCSGVITLGENLVEIDLIIAKILLWRIAENFLGSLTDRTARRRKERRETIDDEDSC